MKDDAKSALKKELKKHGQTHFNYGLIVGSFFCGLVYVAVDIARELMS